MTSSAERLHKELTYGLSDLSSIKVVDGGNGIRVTTHCMYPSNGLVQVTVRGGREEVFASDDGGAVGEALSAGIPVRNIDRQLHYLVRDQGLHVKNGVISTPLMPFEAAPLSVLLVANAASLAAHWMYDNSKIKRSRDFKSVLAEFLNKTFDDRVSHDAVIVGHSNKAHRFANVISLGNGRRLIIDPVVNDASSINARVVANMDVRAANDPSIEQRIVYDDDDDWTPSDLNLLQVGATAIPFTRSEEVIQRIAQSA